MADKRTHGSIKRERQSLCALAALIGVVGGTVGMAMGSVHGGYVGVLVFCLVFGLLGGVYIILNLLLSAIPNRGCSRVAEEMSLLVDPEHMKFMPASVFVSVLIHGVIRILFYGLGWFLLKCLTLNRLECGPFDSVCNGYSASVRSAFSVGHRKLRVSAGVCVLAGLVFWLLILTIFWVTV